MTQSETSLTRTKPVVKDRISSWLRNVKERREFKRELRQGNVDVVVDRMKEKGESVRNVALLLSSFNYNVEINAAWALRLAALKGVDLAPLMGVLEKKPHLLYRIPDALTVYYAKSGNWEKVAELLKNPEERVKESVLKALAGVPLGIGIVNPLIEFLHDGTLDPGVNPCRYIGFESYLSNALANAVAGPETGELATSKLLKALSEQPTRIKKVVAMSLSGAEEPSVVEALRSLLKGIEERFDAAGAGHERDDLAGLNGKAATSLVSYYLRHGDREKLEELLGTRPNTYTAFSAACDVGYHARRGEGKTSEFAFSLMLDWIDNRSPGYGSCLSAFSGGSEMKDGRAFEKRARIVLRKLEEICKDAKSDPDIDFLRKIIVRLRIGPNSYF